jgi:hypothetical protein
MVLRLLSSLQGIPSNVDSVSKGQCTPSYRPLSSIG